MAIKLDTINLDEFLRLNPQLSEEERQEILALDTKKDNTLDRRYLKDEVIHFEPETRHSLTDGHSHIPAWYDHSSYDANWKPPAILHNGEVKSFFKRFGITYSQYINSYNTLERRQKIVGLGAQPAWVASLQIYLFDHLSDDFLTVALGQNDLPMKEGVKLSSNPRENIDHFLDFVEGAYAEKKDEPEKLFQGLNSQHIPLSFRTLDRDSYSPVGIVTMDENPLVTVNFNPDSLFWQTFNPFLKDRELSIDFEKAVSQAVKTLNPNAYASGLMAGNYGNDSCILFADLPKLFILIRSNLETKTATSDTAPPADYVSKAKTAGFILKPNVKNRFEDFITDPEFKSMLHSQKEWTSQFKKEFLSFFQIPPESVGAINLNGEGIWLGSNTAGADFAFHHILKANGYTLLTADSQMVMMRQDRKSTRLNSSH